MVRVAGLKSQQRLGIAMVSDDGQSLSEQLAHIGEAVAALAADRQEVWRCSRPALAEAGVVLLDAKDLKAEESEWLESHFLDGDLSCAHFARDRPGASIPVHSQSRLDRRAATYPQVERQNMTALLRISGTIDRFIRLPSTDLPLIGSSVSTKPSRCWSAGFFPGYSVGGLGAFRVVRDSDIEVEEEAEDLVRFSRAH